MPAKTQHTANSNERIDLIIKEIRKGRPRIKVLSKYVKVWQISDRTFDRLWKTANEQHAELQSKAKEAADTAYILASEQAAKEAVMSKQERMETLTKIARGSIELQKPFAVGGLIETITVVPDYMDRKAAIAELNKMEGDYAPTKLAATDSKGNDIQPLVDYSKLSTEELIQLKKLTGKCTI